ncbi:MAG: cytochrome c biogenesis protein CcsA [Armatimonadetes bacterium]|nr:cytochrome c biogenesis protein CcsA [Armatimonadota bacterium]
MSALGVCAALAWLAAAVAYAAFPRRRLPGDILMTLGVLCGAILIGLLWIELARPPLRTLGETRWWYAVLTPAIGLVVGWRFRTQALGIPACLLGALFALINLLHPEYMDKTLMPALQSPWFVPHVVVYMLSYSALGLSSGIGLWLLARSVWSGAPLTASDTRLPHALVAVGFPLLTCGLLFGALWAKQAWGHYWAWDPKETWALLTWCAYLIYLHVRIRHAFRPALHLSVLGFGFVVLLVCWFGVNYLPTSAESVHTYTRQ